MKDKYIIQNKSGTVLNIAQYKLRLSIGEVVDLVSRLEKTTAELKRDKYILREISFNNLEVIEEYDTSEKSKDIEGKIDNLINILSNQKENNINSIKDEILSTLKENKDKEESLIKDSIKDQLSQININNKQQQNNDNQDNENIEEKMREEALLELLNKQKSYKVKDFGKERKIDGEQEDHSDLIDF